MVKKAASPKLSEAQLGPAKLKGSLGKASETGAKMVETPAVTMTEQPTAGHAVMKGLKILAGIIIGLIGLFLLWYFWGEFALVFKGVIGPVVMLLGLIVVILGWTD